MPPKAIRRLPVSRRKSAKACRTKAAVFFVPVKDLAFSKRLSSRFIVERTFQLPIKAPKILPNDANINTLISPHGVVKSFGLHLDGFEFWF